MTNDEQKVINEIIKTGTTNRWYMIKHLYKKHGKNIPSFEDTMIPGIDLNSINKEDALDILRLEATDNIYDTFQPDNIGEYIKVTAQVSIRYDHIDGKSRLIIRKNHCKLILTEEEARQLGAHLY